MARVPLDGLRIEVPHRADPAALGDRLEAFAQELARDKFRDWAPALERLAGGALNLKGRRAGTHFDAHVTPEPGRVVIVLEGVIELGAFKLTLAGGPEGVRRRIRETLQHTLEAHLQ